MNLLTFDTSSDQLSIAIFKDGEKIFSANDSGNLNHSEALVPSLSSALKKARMAISELDCIAVGIGPGSFTGLRVGVMAAKTLAYSLKIKLIGVSSLEARAWGVRHLGEKIAVLVDARKGNVYAASYEIKNGRIKPLLKPCLGKLGELTRKIKKNVHIVTEDMSMDKPIAESVGELALLMAGRKKFNDPFDLEPQYLYSRHCNVIVKALKK